jgi:beta-propeller repeat-containing protein
MSLDRIRLSSGLYRHFAGVRACEGNGVGIHSSEGNTESQAQNDWVGFAAKLSPGASRVVYSTFIGGSYRTIATAVAVDEVGNAFVVGTTGSSDFSQRPGPTEGQPSELERLHVLPAFHPCELWPATFVVHAFGAIV